VSASGEKIGPSLIFGRLWKELGIKKVIKIFCLNTKQARKDARDRKALIESLKEKIKNDPDKLIGNKGYRKYLKFSRDTVAIDQDKIEADCRFDCKWALKTNTDLSAAQTALKYKELWQVE